MVYILFGSGFEQTEALVPAGILHRAGVPVTLVGLTDTSVTSSHHATITPDVNVEQVTLDAGDMVVLPGGLGGVDAIEHHPVAMNLIRQAAQNPQVWLCAICAAPTLLARAGLLAPGTRAVCYPGMEGDLVKAGAVPCMDEDFVVDGHLITGRAAGSSFEFGFALLNALSGPEAVAQVQAAIHFAP